jgi:hypothetical protein
MRLFRLRAVVRHALVSAGLCIGAHAWAGGIFVPSDDLANDMLNSMLAEQVLQDATQSKPTRGKPAKAARLTHGSTAFIPDAKRTTSVVNQMASRYPAEKRREASQTFSRLLEGYHQIEQQFGVPRYDTAGSVAAFIAGSYMAYRDVDFPDENFKPLVEQMRTIIAANPDFAKASDATKQEMYEQMAILGTLMATTQMALKQNPQPQAAANLRQAAKGYLEQFLKTDADKVLITAQGLVIR